MMSRRASSATAGADGGRTIGDTCSASGISIRRALVQSWTRRSGISATGRTMSTLPVAMALLGMPSYSASAGSCAMTMPPCSFRRPMPAEPSAPVPERTMPMARSRCTSASVRKNRSTTMCRPRGRSASTSASEPSTIDRSWVGGIT